MLVFPEVEFTFRGPIWIPVSRWLVILAEYDLAMMM